MGFDGIALPPMFEVARGDLLGAVELGVLGELDDEILGLEVDLHRIGIELATLFAGLDGSLVSGGARASRFMMA
jgi:hypothetical protein